ncbi:hypothetical protein SLA2020_095730 [Shorea laevis]
MDKKKELGSEWWDFSIKDQESIHNYQHANEMLQELPGGSEVLKETNSGSRDDLEKLIASEFRTTSLQFCLNGQSVGS